MFTFAVLAGGVALLAAVMIALCLGWLIGAYDEGDVRSQDN